MPDSPSDALYPAIVRHYKDLITTGKLGPDEKLPSVEDNVKRFGVAQKTAHKAYVALREAGLVYSTPQGTFVARPMSFVTPSALVLRELSQELQPSQEETTHLTAGVVTDAPGYVLAYWDLPKGSGVGRRESVVSYRDKKRLIVSWHPPHIVALCPQLVANPAQVIHGGTLRLAVDRMGHQNHLFSGTDYMRARAAYTREARLLGIRAGAPILAIVGERRDGQGVIEIVECVYPEHTVVEYQWVWQRQR